MNYQFLSGLPRAGSSLLASLLRQNPQFTASIMTPVGAILSNLSDAMGSTNEAASFITDEFRRRAFMGVFDAYYTGQKASYVFDNNRRWCANADLLANLYPNCKIICCVRSPAAIVDSFERLHREHPLSTSVIYGGQSNLTVYERVSAIMKPGGVLGYALGAFRDAYYGPQRSRLLIVDYDDLCRHTTSVMDDIHLALDVKPFAYNLGKIEPIPGATEFDRKVNTPGLHDLKPKIVYETRTTVLPPDIYAGLPPPFWRVKEEATRAA